MPVRDEDFELFVEDFGEASHIQKVPKESFQMYKGVLPDKLLEYWQLEGWNAYANGLYWIVNPVDYEDLVEQWLEDTHYPEIDNYHCIARSAFGDLFLWGEKTNRSFTVSCPLNAIITMENRLKKPSQNPNLSLQVFFSSGKSKKGLDIEDINSKPLFSQAFKKLGHLAANEVYAFAPALVSGGKAVVENLAKEDLFIHLSILREFSAPTIPNANVDFDALMK